MAIELGSRTLPILAQRSALSDQEAQTPANHVIYADYMNSADDGSVPMMICLILEP